MISCEKTKKTLQRARNNALLIFLHHPKTSFFFVILLPNIPAKIRPPDHWGEGGILVLNSKSPSKLVFIRIRSAMNKEMFIYIYIYLGSLQFSALITTPPTPKYFSKKNIPSC